MDSDSDQEQHAEQRRDQEEEEPGPQRRPFQGRRIHLADFLALIAGAQPELREQHRSNEELVEQLWRSGTIRTPEVKRALLACPRRLFIPEPYKQEAYIDTPVRVEELGFNISAPHIHGTALEALDIKEGDRFLDVGCGCGIMAAAAAQLVGSRGLVAAIDIRPAALELSQKNVAQLKTDDDMYAESSCDIQWQLHNVFIPSDRHMGKYNKVYVGAACPKDRLKHMAQLLSPDGGLMLVPVDSELLLIKRTADGKLGKRVLSAVRFSELEVPRDVDIVMSVMKEETEKLQHVTVPQSTFDADLTLMSPKAGDTPKQSEFATLPMDETQEGSAFKRHKSGLPAMERTPSYIEIANSQIPDLGPPDCYIYGTEPAPHLMTSSIGGSTDALNAMAASRDTGLSEGSAGLLAASSAAAAPAGPSESDAAAWQLPAHRSVLQARCELFRARFSSGMRDALAGALAAPEGVSSSAVRALLHYVYNDTGVDKVPLEQVSEVLHVASFYGCPRLIGLCEERLAAVLTSTQEGADDAAAQVLALAEEVALPQLKQLALNYVVEHYKTVSKCESYRMLQRNLVDAVAAHACERSNHLMSILENLSSAPTRTNNRNGGAVGASLSDDDSDDSDDLR